MNSRMLGGAALFAALLPLAGCAAAPAPAPIETETYVSDTETPEQPAPTTPNPIEPDTTLIVRAIATDANGAQVSLELQVHQSTRWDDIPNQTLPAALVEDCAGTLSTPLFEAKAWSFTRATLTAIPVGSPEWDGRVDVVPSADTVYASGRGILAGDTAATPLCEQSKFFTEAGRGGIAIGIPGDADSFVGWARHQFGFSVPTGAGAATLSECSIEVTPLGASLLGGAVWAATNDASSCATGPTVEAHEY